MPPDKRNLRPAEAAAGQHRPDRREVLVAGGAAAAGVGLLGTGTTAAEDPESLFTQPGDRLQLIKGDHQDSFLAPGLLEVNDRPVEAFPYDPAAKVLRRKNRLNRILVLKLDPAEMDEETRGRSAEGVLAFSALCTHRACTIKSWMQEERRLRCHCHLSEFAALSGGSVKSGPAKRQLPMVPLGVDGDGFIVAMAEFTAKPGAAKK